MNLALGSLYAWSVFVLPLEREFKWTRAQTSWVWSPLREALAEVMSAAGLVRRVGTNLNQAVARLNATGQPGDDLIPAAQFCARVVRRLDETAEQLRRSIP